MSGKERWWLNGQSDTNEFFLAQPFAVIFRRIGIRDHKFADLNSESRFEHPPDSRRSLSSCRQKTMLESL